MGIDLTVIELTANLLPKKFAEFQRNLLLTACGDYPIIRVTRNPGESEDTMWVDKIIFDTEPKSSSNIYRQMLNAAKVAQTPFVAIAEDDCLYPKEHFNFYRPEREVFAYNQNRLALFTWGEPMYHWRNRRSNATLIAPREYLIFALEERFTRWPEGTPEHLTGEVGRNRVELNLDISPRDSIDVFSESSVIQFNHDQATEKRQRTHRKSYGPIKAYDIPVWGRADDLVKKYV